MSAQYIVRPPTAFSLTSGKGKNPRQNRKDHLRWVKSLPCLIDGVRGLDVDPAHVRYGDSRYGKSAAGAAEKPHDQYTVPLRRKHHDAQHGAGDERAWWAARGIDPLDVATKLFAESGNDEAGEMIIASARANARRQHD